MKFKTVDVLSTTTGVLLGDIGGVYKVTSFLIGRPAYTHELAYYGRRASAAIRAAVPSIPTEEDAERVNKDNYNQFLAEWEAKLGTEIDLPDSLRDVLADDRSAVSTLEEMALGKPVIVIKP